jgi:RimJ/RimL family protein N-acetyltransferase
VIQGKLVRLRSMNRDDLPRQLEFNNDLDVELAGGGDPPAPQSLERLQANYDQQAAKGGRDGPAFGIEVNGRYVGQCALFNIDAVARTSEIGITIGDKTYWGRGFGREAIELLLAYGFVHWNLHKIWLRIHAANERAQRAYSACGFGEEGRLREQVWSNGKYDDLLIMGLTAEHWRNHGGAARQSPGPSHLLNHQK